MIINYNSQLVFKRTVGILFLSLFLMSGIGRDDVRLSKYHKFAKDPIFHCIGELSYQKEFRQSFVLIDSNHILTSAHAFYLDSGAYHKDSLYEEINSKWIYGNLAEKQVVGQPNLFRLKIGGQVYTLKRIVIHEKYYAAESYRDEFGLHASEDFNYDIAVAELSRPVKNVQPAKLYEGNQELGKRVIMAGYGYVEKADDYPKNRTFHLRTKMGGENMIDSVGGFKVGDHWAGLFYDFDDPNSACCNRMGDVKPLPLEYFVNGGDCGSGMFIEQNGQWQLAGLCAALDYPSEYFTYGDVYGKYYGFTCYYLRIFAFKDWITSQLN